MKNNFDWMFQLNDAKRMFFRAIKINLFGHKRYSGNVETVCGKVISDCYNKKNNYFMVSKGHFCQFYSRDFGMIIDSLINLGYKDEVRNTLIYAMEKFVSADRCTTQISPGGRPFDFPYHTPESYAYMLHSIIALGDKDLLEKYKSFFQKKSVFIFENDVDKKTGLLRKDKHFSSMKDHSIRVSDCYNNCMLGMFSGDLKKINAKSPLHKYNYPKLIVEHFWNGEFFIEDLSGRNVLSSDANVFPFWTGLVNDKEMFRKTVESMQKKGLDKPFPLKYTAKEDVPSKMHFADLFAYGYEHDTIWVHLAMCFFKVLEKYDVDLLKKYLVQYEDLVNTHKNFLELYFSNGKPFKRWSYVVDEPMSWAAVFLDVKKKYFS